MKKNFIKNEISVSQLSTCQLRKHYLPLRIARRIKGTNSREMLSPESAIQWQTDNNTIY